MIGENHDSRGSKVKWELSDNGNNTFRRCSRARLSGKCRFIVLVVQNRRQEEEIIHEEML